MSMRARPTRWGASRMAVALANWGEYRFLQREQRQIAPDERRAKADGYLSSYERQRLTEPRHLPFQTQRPDGALAALGSLVVGALLRR
jgi:hypothetical protein